MQQGAQDVGVPDVRHVVNSLREDFQGLHRWAHDVQMTADKENDGAKKHQQESEVKGHVDTPAEQTQKDKVSPTTNIE